MRHEELTFSSGTVRLRLTLGSALAIGMLLAGSGCSDSGDDRASSGTTGGEAIVTGSARCDRSSMEEAVSSWSEAYGDGGRATLPDTAGSFRCSNGWAVAFPEVGPASKAISVTAVFEAEGQFWIPKDRSKVCGETPADSEVPASLFRDACQTN